MASTRCYIEKYDSPSGRLGLRLREKYSGRKVNLGYTDDAGAASFLQFLVGVYSNATDVPDVLNKDGELDCILVDGDLDFDAPDEIRYMHNDRLSYLIA